MRVSQLETREKERARVGSLSRGPRGHAGPARNGHLKRGRNGRGAPGVFLTRIPDVRASHLLIPPPLSLRSPAPSQLLLLLSSSPLPFGFLILPLLPSLRLPFVEDRHHLFSLSFRLKELLDALVLVYEIRILDSRITPFDFYLGGFPKMGLESTRSIMYEGK